MIKENSHNKLRLLDLTFKHFTLEIQNEQISLTLQTFENLF